MKFLNILAAVSLALAPALVNAGSADSSTIGNSTVGASSDSVSNTRPISGPVAGHYLKDEEVPIGAIIVGGLVILGGVVIGVLAGGGGGGSNNSTN